jgi:hypothetical protein
MGSCVVCLARLNSPPALFDTKRVGQLINRENTLPVVEFYLAFAHPAQQTQIIKLSGFYFATLLISTDAAVVVQNQAGLGFS